MKGSDNGYFTSSGFKLIPQAQKDLDKYVWDQMWDLSSGVLRISVIELFHHVKYDKELYKILRLDVNNVEHRRIVGRYDNSVPLLKKSLSRLQSKGMMSEPQWRT